MNATEVYNQLTIELAQNPNYIQPTNMLPQQKVAYDITFCLQQFGYGKDRTFDTKNYIYTNDLVIAIIDFQNSKHIRRDGIVGPETFRYFLQVLKANNEKIVVTTTNTNNTGNVAAKDTSTIAIKQAIDSSAVNKTVVQNTANDTINQAKSNVKATIDNNVVLNKSEMQVTLEKYFTGREL